MNGYGPDKGSTPVTRREYEELRQQVRRLRRNRWIDFAADVISTLMVAAVAFVVLSVIW